jgi:hypothetical protein
LQAQNAALNTLIGETLPSIASVDFFVDMLSKVLDEQL